MLVDSHCHLEFPDFVEDRQAMLDRARAAGVGHMVTICTRVRRFAEIQAIAAANDDVSCTLGTHPHHTAEEADVTAAELVAMAADPKVIGIGETGLDYFYDSSPRDVQQAQFRAHLQACRETGLPVIIHTREAEDDTIRILREENITSGVLHCFSSSRKLAEQGLEQGLHISLSGIVTFKKSVELQETAKIVPLDRILVETDAPYLAPMPMRGKRNEPSFVVHTARFVAGLHEIDEAALAAQTTENFFRLFARARRSTTA
jgi:TatD DNase family protein